MIDRRQGTYLNKRSINITARPSIPRTVLQTALKLSEYSSCGVPQSSLKQCHYQTVLTWQKLDLQINIVLPI